jgi:hypothetical protein
MICNYPKCKKKAYYNYEKNGIGYCAEHKKIGMIKIERCIIF